MAKEHCTWLAMNSLMNILSRLKKAVSKSGSISAVKRGHDGCSFKMQLLNLCLYTEEVDSLFCVTIISSHLLNPKKGHPVKVFIDRNCLQVFWFDSEKNPRILCCHPLHTITYQFHTNYKPRLYGYTATWGRKKICLVFQAPRFSRTKGRTIRQYYDKMLLLHCVPKMLIADEQGCSSLLGAPDGEGEINISTSSSKKLENERLENERT